MRKNCTEDLSSHILRIHHTLDPGTRQSSVVLNLATAERNICSADGASSLERHYLGDFTKVSARALRHCVQDLLDKIYLVVEQGGLSYGGGDNGDL